jgi:5'(3')-deoxyribonucleotidase
MITNQNEIFAANQNLIKVDLLLNNVKKGNV